MSPTVGVSVGKLTPTLAVRVTSNVELSLPLTRCSTWESGLYTLPGQHSRADTGSVITGELAPRSRVLESWPCYLSAVRYHGCGLMPSPLLTLTTCSSQVSWPCPCLATALGKAGPVPHLGTTVELVLIWKAWVSQLRGCESQRALLPGTTGQSGGSSAGGEFALVATISVTTQARIWALTWHTPKIYIICE